MSAPLSPSAGRAARVACWALLLLALTIAARGLARRNTWYLASDQFAFLTFADDLRHGRVFHDPAIVLRLTAPDSIRPGESLDALYQTYIFRDRRLYSRYPPGFPALLAVTGLVGGERAQHLLNPALYLVLLGLIALLAWHLLQPHGGDLAAGAAAAVPWVLLTLPAEVHYWGITVARDLPAHLIALAALLAGVRGRLGLGGLLLGVACTIRPDAVLYGLSLGALGLLTRPPLRTKVGAAAAFLVGAAPLFAYNWATEGHPLHFTQAMEFRNLLGSIKDSPRTILAASSLGSRLLSGGAFRLANLPETLPVQAAYLLRAFGAFLLLALGAAVWGTRRRPALTAALVLYAVVAFFFYGCWAHADPRYLVGVSLSLVSLAALGATLWVAALTDPERPVRWRLVAIAATLFLGLLAGHVLPRDAASRLTTLEVGVAAGAAAAGILALVPGAAPAAPRFAPLAPALVLAAVATLRVLTGSGGRDPFQAEQVARARAAVEAVVPAGALVLTSPALGRPAENITHYTHAEAYYTGELSRLRSSTDRAALNYLAAGRRVFILLPAGEPLPFEHAGTWFDLRPVARREGPALYDWFMDPRRATAGAVLSEIVFASASAGPSG
jgi:hypothetical protein